MNRILLIVVFFELLLSINKSYSQSKLSGNVIDSSNQSIEYFTAVILSTKDSSIVMGGAFIDGKFEFSNIKKQRYLLQISSVGYQPDVREIDFSGNQIINIGTIHLKNLELKEVTVLAKRPTFKQKQGKLIINVQGTALSQAGSLFDALRRSPGLIVDNDNNITVFGKGTPIVFINGREVQNKAEIESLQSDDIASIEIDRNPSAEYSASGNSIVKIKTKRNIKDKIKLQIFSRNYFARRYGVENGIQLNCKSHKTSAFISYLHSLNKSKIYETTYENNNYENNIISNKKSTVRIPETKKHNLFVSLNQEINKKNNIGFQFSYVSNNRNQNSKSDQTINRNNDNDIQREIDKYTDGDNALYIYNLNYKYDIDSTSSLSLTGDYTRLEDYSIEDILEQNLSDQSSLRSLIDNKNEYDVYGGKLDFKTCLLQTFNLKTGVKLSKVTNSGRAISTDLNSSIENYRIVDKINDHISSAYFNLKPKINNFKLEAGLRYEYTSTDISSSEESVLDSTYGNWFPSILINKKISDKLDVTLSYSKKISRPTFDELSTDITYFDSFSYRIGNPKVKPTIRHNIDLSAGLSNNLSVNFAYKYEKNARILGTISDEVNPDIVKYTPVNINKAEYINMNIDYNYSGKNVNSTVSVGGQKPSIKIPYLDGIRRMENLSWYFQSNVDYSITNKIMFFLNFWYLSENQELMTEWDEVYNLSIGINTFFFNKKLNLSFMVNDILDSSDSAYEDKYENIISGTIYDHDNTWFRFSVKYNFNNFRIGASKKSASSSELNRL